MAGSARRVSFNSPITADGRYLVERKRLWRCANPHLSKAGRQALVVNLMAARREIGRCKQQGYDVSGARAAVDQVKVALGERGPVWWDDGAPDFNRKMACSTPYAD